ncbi:hypothetical protein ACQP2X_36625 [Actinoplanes sp. CA-131856]
MGYELHITRAFDWAESERFPILGAEVEALVGAEPDLSFVPGASGRPDVGHVVGDSEHWLFFWQGRLSIKHPEPYFVRRMVELGERLDAWVTGDDSAVYGWNGEEVLDWQRERDAFALRRRFISSGDRDTPIRPDEWAALVAAQPDFAMMTSVRATLPTVFDREGQR